MDATELQSGITRHFGEALEPEVVSELASICQALHEGPEDLFYKYEAFSFNKTNTVSIVTVERAREFRLYLNRQLEEAAKKQKQQLGRQQMLQQQQKKASAKTARASNVAQSSASSSRPSAHSGPAVAQGHGVKFSVRQEPLRSYRYMHEKISHRSETLDDRIDEFAELVRLHYSIEEFADPTATSEEEVYVVGRICCDAEAKLNEASTLLESSRMMGSGARVPLKFDANVQLVNAPAGQGGFGIFPGAIVALKGKNGSGASFLVTSILSLPALPPPPETSHSTIGLDAIVACGPYTFDSDLLFKPLTSLLEKVKATQPSVVFLLGPFIDIGHPLIKAGKVDDTLETMFTSLFADKLLTALNDCVNTTIFLVPSVKDAISNHLSFPQPGLSRGDIPDAGPRLQLLPNPCVVDVQGVSFALSTVDVLFHLRKEELFKRVEDPAAPKVEKDAMGILCRHVLSQRSFYPIFPVPRDLSADVNLDISHSQFLKFDHSPDVLVLPSALKQFQKVVDHTLVLNPSFLARASSMGSYVNLRIPAPTSASSPVYSRASAEIEKL